jgi:hypothetical protein
MSEMTDSAATPAPVQKASFFDDVIEIFIHPTNVVRRRANSSVWPPMLFVAIVVGIISFATFNTLAPAFEADFSRAMAKTMAKNPQMTQEMADKSRDMMLGIGKYTLPIIMLITMFLLGVVTWGLSKVVGAATTFQQCLGVAAWAYCPRIIGALAGGVQGLLMDPANLTSTMSFTLSPARFMNPETANPLLMQLAARFDLITIWVTILLAIGVYVTGRVSKGKAIAFGVLIFVVGALPAIRNGYMMM